MNYKIPLTEIPSELKADLSRIENTIDNLNLKRDEGLSKELLDNLKRQLLIKQVYHSNAIEGNKLSLRETELILNGMVINERPLKDEIEAKSLARATEYLYSLIDGREPLTKRTLLELHSLIMQNIPGIVSGAFRNHEVQIKNAKHIPPTFHDVEVHVDELFQWMNRNSHKYSPMVMGSILHHWMTWIHPFTDGNGRVSRMFLNFFLLQKGYPEVVIKISDRDDYYNSLIAADNGNVIQLLELLVDNIQESISAYEELINEDQRQKEWIRKYKEIKADEYNNVKSKHSYEYEVWKHQMAVFKTLFKKSFQDVANQLSGIEASYREYEIISFNQYLDILEDKPISKTSYMYVKLFDKNKHESLTLVFYFQRLYMSKLLNIAKEEFIRKGQTNTIRIIPPAIKLNISARKNGIEIRLDEKIDLVNIGTYKDQLSFGIVNRTVKRDAWQKPKLESRTDNPGVVIRHFIDQILQLYLDIQP
jgi:Fic family protein